MFPQEISLIAGSSGLSRTRSHSNGRTALTADMVAQSDSPMPRVRRQSDLQIGETLIQLLSARTRRVACAGLGAVARLPAKKEWIQFQFYHWVLDDQRTTFRRQLAYLRQHADFLSLDDAVRALQNPAGIGGRFFCVTFDDGFKLCFTNAAPLLSEFNVPAAFFIPTRYIGLDLQRDWQEIAPFYDRAWSKYRGAFEFLDWDECRQLAAAGFTIGSHTNSHRRLTSLQPEEVEQELIQSKQVIEARLGRPCHHFCCPWGKRNRDFDPAVHPEMARRAGYASFLTAEEGLSLSGDSPYDIRRSGCEPDLTPWMLRYALFPPFPAISGKLRAKPVQLRSAHASLSVSEPEPVRVGKFPHPYQAAFAVASDIDSASLARFQAVHALFCGQQPIRPHSAQWDTLGIRTDRPDASSNQAGLPGLGLDFADSFFLVGDKTTFGMYRHVQDQDSFREDRQDGQSCAELIWQGLKTGQIDSLHSLLHFTRKQLAPLLREFYERCEQDAVPKPRVWINHSLAVTPTGLCPRRLQPNPALRFARLSARQVVGPLFGRARFPLGHAFARYQGDNPGSDHYVNDLLAANGLRYVWLNMDDLHRNRIALPERELNGRSTFLQPITMQDGIRYYRFERCYGKPPDRRGGEAYLRDSEAGFDASVLITESNLEALCRTGGSCILYVHWTHPRSFPIPHATIARFELLRRWRDAEKIWVTSTSKLLEWTRRRTFLHVVSRREGQHLRIELSCIEDPIFGREAISLSELHGLSLLLPDTDQPITVAVNGQALGAKHVRRSGKVCWLDAQ